MHFGMAEILLFHHAQGLTPGVAAFADELRAGGHTVHAPDYYEGRTFETVEEGVDHARSVGFQTVVDRALAAAEGFPDASVYAGFSLGVNAAQQLAQTRPGARAALLFEAAAPPGEFGDWPAGVRLQVHGMDADPWFSGEDLDAAKALVASVDDAELFLYPGDRHLFADSSLASYDAEAASLLTRRVLEFLSPL
jgi:dienelactone hydrolase